MFTGMMLSGQSTIFKNITLSSNQVDWNLITDGFGGIVPTKRAVVTITIDAAVELTSSTTSIPAMDLTGLPTNSSIALINNGLIFGSGGDGGKGNDAVPDP